MKQQLLLLSLVLLTLAGVAGIPSWPTKETAVGYYAISKNPYGVAIYQDGPHASVQFVNAKTFTVTGSTITIPGVTRLLFSRDDIIVDESLIYTDPPQQYIDYLGKVKTTNVALPDTVYLINPHIPGMLEFRGQNMHIDREQKQIEGNLREVIVHDAQSI